MLYIFSGIIARKWLIYGKLENKTIMENMFRV